jgi:hypothetical protein
VTAQAESQQRTLAGRGEGSRVMQIGLSEASVLLRKIQSFGDPRLYALSVVAEHLSHSNQPLVPERVFMAGMNGENGHGSAPNQGMLGLLINLLVAEKSGFKLDQENPDVKILRDDGSGMSREDVELAPRNFSTSKITDASDLERIATYGFRGEALAALRAQPTPQVVSELTIMLQEEALNIFRRVLGPSSATRCSSTVSFPNAICIVRRHRGPARGSRPLQG